MFKINSIAFAVLTALAAACGSDDPITAIDRSTDCSSICDKYKDCIKGDYDTDRCASDCRDMTSSDETSKIDKCQDCLKGNSCTESVFNCTSECAGIVP